MHLEISQSHMCAVAVHMALLFGQLVTSAEKFRNVIFFRKVTTLNSSLTQWCLWFVLLAVDGVVCRVPV